MRVKNKSPILLFSLERKKMLSMSPLSSSKEKRRKSFERKKNPIEHHSIKVNLENKIKIFSFSHLLYLQLLI
jgi:hypothetical protein